MLLLLSPLAREDKAAVIMEPGTLKALPVGADAIETMVELEALAMALASWRWALRSFGLTVDFQQSDVRTITILSSH